MKDPLCFCVNFRSEIISYSLAAKPDIIIYHRANRNHQNSCINPSRKFVRSQ